jgi:hypothetical protein
MNPTYLNLIWESKVTLLQQGHVQMLKLMWLCNLITWLLHILYSDCFLSAARIVYHLVKENPNPTYLLPALSRRTWYSDCVQHRVPPCQGEPDDLTSCRASYVVWLLLLTWQAWSSPPFRSVVRSSTSYLHTMNWVSFRKKTTARRCIKFTPHPKEPA